MFSTASSGSNSEYQSWIALHTIKLVKVRSNFQSFLVGYVSDSRCRANQRRDPDLDVWILRGSSTRRSTAQDCPVLVHFEQDRT